MATTKDINELKDLIGDMVYGLGKLLAEAGPLLPPEAVEAMNRQRLQQLADIGALCVIFADALDKICANLQWQPCPSMSPGFREEHDKVMRTVRSGYPDMTVCATVHWAQGRRSRQVL